MELDIYKNKRVLITGHTGFKGSWLCYWLKTLGATVFGYSTKLTVPDHFSLLNIDGDFTVADISDYEKLKKTIDRVKPEIIFHLAAQPLVRESYKEPLLTYRTNVIGTANLLQACRGSDTLKAIVCVTSDKCYENKEWLWGYRETEPMGGFDPYSSSKACSELLIASFRNSFFSLDNYGESHQVLIASARAGNVIGGGDWSTDRLVPDIIRAASADKETEIRSPFSIRPWQHVLDCLHGYLLLGSRLMSGDKNCAAAFNFGPNDSDILTVSTVLKLCKANWTKIKYKFNEEIPALHEAKILKLDSSKAKMLLKWSPLWNSEECMKKTILWYRNFIENKIVNTSEDINAYMRGLSDRPG